MRVTGFSQAMAPLTCGEALLRLLEQYAVDTVFGIPGTHTLELYRGIAKSNVQHIQARHEQGAGFMADGYARVRGKPGVCMVISGPGVTNITTALGQAYADSIPLLLISSVTPSTSLHKGWGCLHEISDQQAVTAPLTAFSATVRSPAELPELIGQAFAIFAAARPRPVHIAIPTDLLAQPIVGEWMVCKPPARPLPDPIAVRAAVALLARAERPILMLGGGLLNSHLDDKDLSNCLTELAERLGAGIITSNAGKGLVRDSHPLNLGASISRSTTQRYLARADVVVALGTELADSESFVERLEINGKIIRVDIDHSKLNDLYPAEIGLIGDAGATATRLLDELRSNAVKSDWAAVAQEIATVRTQLSAELSPAEQQHQRLCQLLRAILPADAVVMADMTQLSYTGSLAFPTEQPRRWLHAAGYCTLGCALPMAIGAKVAQPQQPVAVLVGDGGFLFTVQELATAVELGLSLPIILWNNDGFGEIRDGMNRRNIPPIGVSGRNPDFVALMQAFGGRGVRPTGAEAFTTAIAEALHTPMPTLIEVRQDAPWLT